MNIILITNDAELKQAAAALDAWIDAHDLNNLSPKEAAEFRLLTSNIEAYENKRFPIEYPDPIDFLEFMMEQNGLKVKDIASCIGSPSRAYEVLNRKRKLTVPMISKLRTKLHCPADPLIPVEV